MSSSVVNLTAYHFVTLDDLPRRRADWKTFCTERQIKGTILLSPEGINLFLAASREAIDAVVAELRSDPLLAGITIKESLSDYQPFNKLRVRLKREIIACGIPGIDPAQKTAPKIRPEELKQWLDEGRPITLLDTRNVYEIEAGTFAGAVHLDIRHFRQFPEAIRSLPEEWKQRPIVMFCTGGIRCEKAGPVMEQAGFQQIFQLDGGILKYFEDCGQAHWNGTCFVFDQRETLDAQLREKKAE